MGLKISKGSRKQKSWALWVKKSFRDINIIIINGSYLHCKNNGILMVELNVLDKMRLD